MTLLYRINLSKKQMEELNETELTFVNLFNMFRWAFRPGRKEDHPINIFRNLKNPKNHNLIDEMEHIKNYLSDLHKKRPSGVWRGLDWSQSMQNWLLKTAPRIDSKEIQREIIPSKRSNIENGEDLDNRYYPFGREIEKIILKLEKMEFVASESQIQRFRNHIDRLRVGFAVESIDLYHTWFYFYPGVLFDYFEELLRLRIQSICREEPDMDMFISYLLGFHEYHILGYFFLQHIKGKKTVTRNLTRKSLREIQGLEKKDENKKSNEKSEYIKVNWDENKLYSISDIRKTLEDSK